MDGRLDAEIQLEPCLASQVSWRKGAFLLIVPTNMASFSIYSSQKGHLLQFTLSGEILFFFLICTSIC